MACSHSTAPLEEGLLLGADLCHPTTLSRRYSQCPFDSAVIPGGPSFKGLPSLHTGLFVLPTWSWVCWISNWLHEPPHPAFLRASMGSESSLWQPLQRKHLRPARESAVPKTKDLEQALSPSLGKGLVECLRSKPDHLSSVPSWVWWLMRVIPVLRRQR